MPSNSKIGSSFPSTRTTKLPLPGFSFLFISTSASQSCSARYLAILFARVLNTDHCLQASMETITPPEESAFFCGDLDFLSGLALVAVAFLALAADMRDDFTRPRKPCPLQGPPEYRQDPPPSSQSRHQPLQSAGFSTRQSR